MARSKQRRISFPVFAVGVAMAILCLSAAPAVGAMTADAVEPSVTIADMCGFDAPFGVWTSSRGFAPNTTYDVSLTYEGFSGAAGLTTDAEGGLDFSWSSYSPMGLVTFTYGGVVATIQDPCEPPTADVTPPAIEVPSFSPVVDATTPQGAVVSYSVGVSDNRPSPSLACDPPSGDTFRAGETIVTCTASDAAGNTTTTSFEVTVRGAADQLRTVRASLLSSGLPAGLTTALKSVLTSAIHAADAQKRLAACGLTRAFDSALLALRGHHVDATTANLLVVETLRARLALGCSPSASPFTEPTLLLEPACDPVHIEIGFPGHYGAAATLEGFEPGATVTVTAHSSALNATLSTVVTMDALGGYGPLYGSVPFALGTLTDTAFVDGVQVAQASLQDPCDP